MPFEYKIDEQENTVVIEAIGHCDVPTCVDFLENVVSDPSYNWETKILFETKYGNAPTLTEAYQLSEVLESIKELHGHEIAVVAPTALLLDVNRLISRLPKKKNIDIQVFITTKEAKDWLGGKEFTN